jgi:hypothetical protein
MEHIQSEYNIIRVLWRVTILNEKILATFNFDLAKLFRFKSGTR